ncbi:hypothetical protein PF008_g17355 [Phytophthora fragariae]|uniref:Uncharacterized protein n=1 Tax=Phytophthora fragariae TaxID=53985 RepID=A0A6G0R8Z2_9STRA|nr:hypothetical protein PF008_g17355 [Phytophthora fragariae]
MDLIPEITVVNVVAPLPCQVMVLVTAPPMVAWCMLPVVDVVVVLCADDGSLGVAESWILPNVGTGGHFMFLVVVFLLLGQVKVVAVVKVLAVACALLLKMFMEVAWRRHQDDKALLAQVEITRLQ